MLDCYITIASITMHIRINYVKTHDTIACLIDFPSTIKPDTNIGNLSPFIRQSVTFLAHLQHGAQGDRKQYRKPETSPTHQITKTRSRNHMTPRQIVLHLPAMRRIKLRGSYTVFGGMVILVFTLDQTAIKIKLLL